MARLCWVYSELLSSLLLFMPLPAQTTAPLLSDQPLLRIQVDRGLSDAPPARPPRVLSQAGLDAYLDQVNGALGGPWPQPALRFAIDANLVRGASLLADGRMSLPAVVLRQMRNEAELAALLAHLQVHRAGNKNQVEPLCILIRSPGSSSRSSAEAENAANRTAVMMLKAAGYEPGALIDLLSRVSYENPDWSGVLRPEDLLVLRVTFEQEEPPSSGYRVDSNRFGLFQGMLAEALGERERMAPALSTSLPATPRRVY